MFALKDHADYQDEIYLIEEQDKLYISFVLVVITTFH